MSGTLAAQFPTEAQANAFADSVDAALGFPKRGTHIGDGRHVIIPDTWDGVGAVPPGWTMSYSEVHTAPGKDPVVPLNDAEAAFVSANVRSLTAADASDVRAALAARVAVDLDAQGYAPKRRPPRVRGVQLTRPG